MDLGAALTVDLLDVIEGAKQAVGAVLPKRYLRVDVAARSLSLSDELLVKAVETLAREHAPSTRLKLTAAARGFLAKAAAGREELRAVLELRSLSVADGELTITLESHGAPTLEGRPVVNFVISLVIKVVGGTKLAEAVASLFLPQFVRTDLRTVTVKTALEGFPGAAELKGLLLEAAAARADGWTRLTVSSAEGLAAVQSVLMKVALSSLGLSQSR